MSKYFLCTLALVGQQNCKHDCRTETWFHIASPTSLVNKAVALHDICTCCGVHHLMS